MLLNLIFYCFFFLKNKYDFGGNEGVESQGSTLKWPKKKNLLTRVHARTCNLASVELKSKGDAILPGLRPDPNKPGQDRLRDAVQHHLGRVRVSVESLGNKGK